MTSKQVTSVGPPVKSIFGGPASIATRSTQNSAVTVSADEDSEDCDLNAVIRKQAAKTARLTAPNRGAFRPESVPVPPAFRTATPLDVNAFPNFLAFQSTVESPKDRGEDKVNGICKEVHRSSTANKTVDENEKRIRRKELQNNRHSKHHHKNHRSTNTNINNNDITTTTATKNNEGNGIGSSHKRPILLDDSGDEGGEASTHIAKKMKTEGSLHLTKENLGALEASSHKPSVSSTKVSGRKTHKGSKADRSSRKKERRHRSSLPGMGGPAGDASKRAEKAARTAPKVARVERAARTDSNTPRVDKPPKRNEGSHPQTAESAAGAANTSAQPRINTEIWLQNLMRPVETRPTPIATVIDPTLAPRPNPEKAVPLTAAPTRRILQATIAQDKAEEFKRKRLEDNKRREEEIATQKEAREIEKNGRELPTDDATLFQAFAAKVPEAPKTRVVSDLPSNNYQRPEKGKRPTAKKIIPTQGSTNIFAPRPRPAAAARRPVGRPRKAAAPAVPANSIQYRDENDDGGEDGGEDGGDNEEYHHFQPPSVHRPLARRRATTAAQPDYHNQAAQPAPLAPPRNIRSVPALAALGPGRLVFKWTVCRTKPFIPQGVETRADYRLEMEKGTGCASHLINDKALTLFNKPKKGVAGKGYDFVVSRRGGVDLFDGWVKFKTGEVACIWVEEGVVDVGELNGVEVDEERAEMLMRRRWDVVSVHLMKKDKEVVAKEVVREKGKVLVIECGGEEEGGQNGDKHCEGNGDGEEEEEGLWGESSTAVQTATNTTVNTPTDTATTSATTTTTTTPITTLQDFLDSIETVPTFHGCFTTEADARRAALETFLCLAEPTPSQPDEDKHHFEYTVKPSYEDLVNEAIETGAEHVPIEWDPDTKYKWNFFRLTVLVDEAEFKGPINISDLVVEGHEGVLSGGTAATSAVLAPTTTTQKPTRSTEPGDYGRTLLRPSTPPPPSAERRWVLPVAPATAKAPEKPAPVPNTIALAAGRTSSVGNLPATGTDYASTTNQPTNTPPNPAPNKPAPPPVQAALFAAAQAARHAAAGLPLRPVAGAAGATSTPPFAQTRAPFAMVGDDESEVSEEE